MANDTSMVRVMTTIVFNITPIILLMLAGDAETTKLYYSYALAATVCALIGPIVSSKWGIRDQLTTLLQWLLWEVGWITSLSPLCE